MPERVWSFPLKCKSQLTRKKKPLKIEKNNGGPKHSIMMAEDLNSMISRNNPTFHDIMEYLTCTFHEKRDIPWYHGIRAFVCQIIQQYHGMTGYSMIHGMEAHYRHCKFLGPQLFFFFFKFKGSFHKIPYKWTYAAVDRNISNKTDKSRDIMSSYRILQNTCYPFTRIWYSNDFRLSQRRGKDHHRVLTSPDCILQLVQKIVRILIRIESSLHVIHETLRIQELHYLLVNRMERQILNPIFLQTNIILYIHEKQLYVTASTILVAANHLVNCGEPFCDPTNSHHIPLYV